MKAATLEPLKLDEQLAEFADWLPEERAALRPPEPLTVTQWADKYRILPQKGQAEPGPFDSSRNPYIREIMDSVIDPDVRETSFMKSTQVGGTEVMLNILGYIMDQDPDPTCYLMPTDRERDDFMRDRVKPMIENTPKLRKMKPAKKKDWLKTRIDFPQMTFFMIASGSASGLSSRPIRWVLEDEIDKYPESTGKEAHPCNLVEKRAQSFKGDARFVRASTPTTQAGAITQRFEKSDKRRYHIPCPHCGTYQFLKWPQVKFPKGVRDPQRIRDEGLAHYECESCKNKISDAQKLAALQEGVWVPEGATINKKGKVKGAKKGSHRGYHIWAGYSPWIEWADLVAAFLETWPVDPQDWINSWLGEPWVERDRDLSETLMKGRQLDYPRSVVHPDAIVLTAGVDCQQGDVFYYVIRAWGHREHSWLVEAGSIQGWTALEELLLASAWPRHGSSETLGIRRAAIDSGSFTPQVYRFARKHAHIVKPIKGASTSGGAPITRSNIDKRQRGSKVRGGLVLYLLDTSFFKDKFTTFARATPDERGALWLHESVSPEYLSQVTAEHKVRIRKKVGGFNTRWEIKPGHGGNHLFDAEIYAMAAAEMLGVYRMRDPDNERPEGERRKSNRGASRHQRVERRKRGWMTR